MLEDKKIQIARNKEFVDEYLYERGLATTIADHPRYDSILWKLSNFIRKSNSLPYQNGAKDVLNSIVSIESNGDLVLCEGISPEYMLVTSKYYIDDSDEKLRRLRTETDKNGEIKIVALSLYNDDGIEEALATEQNTEYGKYFSKAVRLDNRPDIIKIERVKSEKGDLKRLEDIYQIRSFQAALEDIYPDREEIDPLDTMHFSILGLPPIYEDLPKDIMKIIKKRDGKITPLLEKQREEIFREYKKLNDMYGRTKAFEKGMKKVLVINSNLEK